MLATDFPRFFERPACDNSGKTNLREGGQLYAAWRKGSPAIRQRILDAPDLFFKAQRQAEEKAPAGTGALFFDSRTGHCMYMRTLLLLMLLDDAAPAATSFGTWKMN